MKSLLILTGFYAVAFVGATAENSALSFWYIAELKPAWGPPGWLLVPAWLVLHGFFAAAFLSLPRPFSRAAGTGFGLTLALNAVWAVTLFGVHRPLPALVIAIAAWLATLALALTAGRANPPSGRWLIPCVLWATYAGAFTGALWRLNR